MRQSKGVYFHRKCSLSWDGDNHLVTLSIKISAPSLGFKPVFKHNLLNMPILNSLKNQYI